MDIVELGTTGIHVSQLSYGTGTNGWGGRSNQTDLGLDELSDLLIYGFEHGITFWDSADQYGSHIHLARAMEQIGRDKIVITSKANSSTAKEVERDMNRMLEELGTDYIDIVLMHGMGNANWPNDRAGVMEVLAEKKEAGIIRAHGVSCHDFDALQQAAITPWVDVVLARINYAGTKMDAPPEKIVPVLEQMDTNDIGVYGMKVVGCGDLVPRDAIHYALDIPAIDAITIGMMNRREIDENIGWVEEHSTTLQPA
jgi:aryl-alcohol dehydrogenase-like predicted oxidoreductase